MTRLLRVANWFAWAPGLETREAWRLWAGQRAGLEDQAESAALPMMLRRRLSLLGQKLVAAALSCGNGMHSARFILATRHGELKRTADILRALAANEAPSPADFSLSVHHGLAGLLSIHTGNRKGHTAISAGSKSFSNGLIEAAASLHANPKEPILLLFGEEPAPKPYDTLPFDSFETEYFALAILLHGQDGFELTIKDADWADITAKTFLGSLLKTEAEQFLA